MKKIYTGWARLYEEPVGEYTNIFFLSKEKDGPRPYEANEEPLAERIQEDMQQFGKRLSVQYFISDVSLDIDQLHTAWLNRIEGIGKAKYYVKWSEYTGYLWTDEVINVGGHDLLSELQGYEGKYIHLEIEYLDSPESGDKARESR